METAAYRFFETIKIQRAAYFPGFSFIARREGGEFVIGQASVSLNTRGVEIPATRFNSENLRAGYFSLSDLGVSVEQMFEQILSGTITTPEGNLVFNPSPIEGYPISFDPFHEVGLQSQSRLNVLRITGDKQILSHQRQSLDWELRGSSVPYDNVQELMNEYRLGLLRTDLSLVEFVAFNVVVVEFASKVEGAKASPRMRLANGLDTNKAMLGYRVVMRGQTVDRGSIPGEKLTWEDGEIFKTGTGEVEIPVNAALQCFASYAGVSQHFGWLADPLASQNPRRAVYEAFDGKLKVLKDIFAKAQGRGSQVKDFEAGVAWLLWMLGFSVAHLGGIPRTQDAVDLVAVAPDGSFAVIECTTGLLKAENKMALLNDRVQAVRQKLASSENAHIRVLPMMVTSKSKEEIKPDLEQAEKLGIIVVTKDDFEQAILRTLVFPEADKIIAEGLEAARLAEAKHTAE